MHRMEPETGLLAAERLHFVDRRGRFLALTAPVHFE